MKEVQEEILQKYLMDILDHTNLVFCKMVQELNELKLSEETMDKHTACLSRNIIINIILSGAEHITDKAKKAMAIGNFMHSLITDVADYLHELNITKH